MSCPLPLCCVMGTCAYDILHWQRVFQERNKRNLPCGVYDDKKWTSSNNREDITKEEGGINMKAVENAHEKLEKKSSVWSPFTGRKEQGRLSFIFHSHQAKNCICLSVTFWFD